MTKVPIDTTKGRSIEYILVFSQSNINAIPYPIPATGIIGLNTDVVEMIVSPNVISNVLIPSTVPSHGEGNMVSPGRINIVMPINAAKKARAASPRRDWNAGVGVMHIELLLYGKMFLSVRNASIDNRKLDLLPLIWGELSSSVIVIFLLSAEW
jgi:hypothetical protein